MKDSLHSCVEIEFRESKPLKHVQEQKDGNEQFLVEQNSVE